MEVIISYLQNRVEIARHNIPMNVANMLKNIHIVRMANMTNQYIGL